MKLLKILCVLCPVLLVVLFTIYFFNIDMKAVRKIYDKLNIYYDQLDKKDKRL